MRGRPRQLVTLMGARGQRRGGRHTPAANGSKWIRRDKRLAIYLRDGLTCTYCTRFYPHIELQLDHYARVEDGGTNEATNLLTVCRSCNSAKTNLTIRQWYGALRRRGDCSTAVGRRARAWKARCLTEHRERAKELLMAHGTMVAALAVHIVDRQRKFGPEENP